MPSAGGKNLDSELNYELYREKLPKGLSFPLKRSRLDTALEEARINLIRKVFYSARCPEDGTILSSCMLFPSSFSSNTISLYPVANSERKTSETLLIQFALPHVVRWLIDWQTSIACHPDNYVQRPPTGMSFYIENQSIMVRETLSGMRNHQRLQELGRIGLP